MLALIGSDVKLTGGRSGAVAWYSARRKDYLTHLVGEGGWFEVAPDSLLIRNINYDLQGALQLIKQLLCICVVSKSNAHLLV